MPDFWSWSLRLFEVRGITVRAHWSLLIIVIYDLVTYARGPGPVWLAPVLVGILFLSILLHEFGHAFAARGLGGYADRIVLWMMGGLAECSEPMRPWPKFAVAAAGPAVSGALAAIGWAAGTVIDDGIPGLLCGYLALVNLRLLLFNLLPCFPLDGGRMFIAMLWPVIGLRRAVTACLITSYPICAGLILWALLDPSAGGAIALGLGFWLFSSLLREHAMMRNDGSHAFGLDLGYGGSRRDGSWFSRWRERRRVEAEIRRDRDDAAEEAMLDELLAKVSEHGLPSLTAQERGVLERISRKQRERQET